MLSKNISIILAMASSVVCAPTNSTSKPATSGLSVTAQLQLADTVADRYNILSSDKDFVFDLGANNGLALANRKTFPALVGTGVSFTAARFPACSISKLHIHPRAAESLIVLKGKLVTETVPEFGVMDASGKKQRVIHNELGPGMMTVFHQGAFHTQINPGCEEVETITTFSSEDGGFGFVADQTFLLPDDVISAQLGDVIPGQDIDRIRKALPQGLGAQIDACLKKCNIPKRQVETPPQ